MRLITTIYAKCAQSFLSLDYAVSRYLTYPQDHWKRDLFPVHGVFFQRPFSRPGQDLVHSREIGVLSVDSSYGDKPVEGLPILYGHLWVPAQSGVIRNISGDSTLEMVPPFVFETKFLIEFFLHA